MKIHRAAAFAQDWGSQEHGQSWSRSGKLPDRRTPSGHRHCTDADVDRWVERDTDAAGSTVVYRRVSSRAQQDDLRSQQQAMETFCPGAGLAVDEWLSEIGGGLNFKQPVFRALMTRIERRELDLLLIAHQDRLCRFGFDWFEYLADPHGCGIRVVHQPSLSPQAELVENPVAVVHAFSGRLSGLRRYRRQIREAATDG